MTTYYYELPEEENDVLNITMADYGEYEAESDEDALRLMPKNALILYKESDTPDGLPFIDIYP